MKKAGKWWREADLLTPESLGKYPKRSAVIRLTEGLCRVMVPGVDRKNRRWQLLMAGLRLKLLLPRAAAREFLRQLPEIRQLLVTDLQAALAADPAATGPEEVLICYPGLRAILIYRLAHGLYALGQPVLARIMTEYAHSQTGIDIHPGAAIGSSFFIDHGTGVVIGQTTVIADHVRLYQGVTLGALTPAWGMTGGVGKRHPTLEPHVTVYANATILGGDTVIGRGSVIGAGSFVTHSVPPHTTVVPLHREYGVRNNPQEP